MIPRYDGDDGRNNDGTLSDPVAEVQHQRVGRMDGRDTRRRGGIRLRASPERVAGIHRQGARAGAKDDLALLAIRIFRVGISRRELRNLADLANVRHVY